MSNYKVQHMQNDTLYQVIYQIWSKQQQHFFLHETLDLTHVRSVEKKEMKNMKRDTIRYFLLIKATNAWNKKSAINLTNRYANDTDTHSPNATKSMW